MDANKEDMRYLINRFAWVDNNTFRIVSQDGIERLVDIKDNFKEIQFNVIPLYNKENC